MFCQSLVKRSSSLADVVVFTVSTLRVVHYPTEVCDGVFVFGGPERLLVGLWEMEWVVMPGFAKEQ